MTGFTIYLVLCCRAYFDFQFDHLFLISCFDSLTFIGLYREIAIAIQDEVGDSNGDNV